MNKIEELENKIAWERMSLPFPGFDKPYLAAGMDRIHSLRLEIVALQAAEMLKSSLYEPTELH